MISVGERVRHHLEHFHLLWTMLVTFKILREWSAVFKNRCDFIWVERVGSFGIFNWRITITSIVEDLLFTFYFLCLNAFFCLRSQNFLKDIIGIPINRLAQADDFCDQIKRQGARHLVKTVEDSMRGSGVV